ncbi:hypothetical protein SPOG_03860 [Schizosaccharomyces cryophilus OY26]|uniref:CBS and PB1 domain-containing protein n=1 Tax=Schizosaccharomyces cryophilus (strain OY26 / ATCC MYA-4695 / CBS 11777 / NBRC 106824 / NRRL Y48691) TaxID=653667 RepID=S9X8B7_SCHCR|nr:uncharacterized protein SPOG_03860 [Schizosaccharomyces cryophilus OY26]EPY53332.1 hypothetical protein SPOG_03860 [Schizosaccharomyces cryophilus OY26]
MPANAVDNSSVVSSSYSDVSYVSDTRKRQYKRDEALRRKIATELSKKQANLDSPAKPTNRHGEPGTVESVALDAALTVHMHSSITETAQLMAAKRQDCVLVVDEEGQLTGILTSSDIATKCVGAGFDARQTYVADIMTNGPICITSDTRIDAALELMVEHQIRHLPVVSDGNPNGDNGDEGDVIGIINMRTCLREPLDRIARQQEAAERLVAALEGAQEELEDRSVSGSTNNSSHSGGPHAAEFIEYVESLRKKASGQDVLSLIESTQEPILVGTRTTVAEAAESMAHANVSSVLVMDNGAVSGIFTSHDIVLRVLAAGLDAFRCSVIRVMTPHPDCALIDLRVSTALERMLEGKFHFLPIVDEDDSIVGLLSLFHLATAILAEQSPEEDEGLDHESHELEENILSKTASQENHPLLAPSNENVDSPPELPIPNQAILPSHQPVSPEPHTLPTSSTWQETNYQLPEKDSQYSPSFHGSHVSYRSEQHPLFPVQSNGIAYSEHPSAVDAYGASDIHGYGASQTTPSYVGSLSQFQGNPSIMEQALQDLVQPTDSASQIFPIPRPSPSQFSIKYRSTIGRVHRLRLDQISSLSDLQKAVSNRENEPNITLTYIDDEGDVVEITSDADLREAIFLTRRRGLPRLEIRGVGANSHVVDGFNPVLSTVGSSTGTASVLQPKFPVDEHISTSPQPSKASTKKPSDRSLAFAGIVSGSIAVVILSAWFLRRKR